MTEQQIKAAVRKRDGFRCTQCGITNEEHLELQGKQLEVHRFKRNGQYSVSDECATLCRRCHAKRRNNSHGRTVVSVKMDADLVKMSRLLVIIEGIDMVDLFADMLRNPLRSRLEKGLADARRRYSKPDH